MGILKGRAARDDADAGRNCLIVVFLAQHGGQAALFGDGIRIAGGFFLKAAALQEGEARAVLQRFGRDAGDVDARAAVHGRIFFDQRRALALGGQRAGQRFSTLAKTDDDVIKPAFHL